MKMFNMNFQRILSTLTLLCLLRLKGIQSGAVLPGGNTTTQPPTTVTTTPEYNGCNLAPCIQQPGCGGFERCLLEATSKGCNSYTIAFAAKEKYLDCLYGPEGFCSLEPLAHCYDNHLLTYTKASIPKSLRYRPEKLTRFIDGTISNPTSYLKPITTLNNRNCTIQRSVIVDMASCVGDAFATASMECTSVMPVARQTFFGIINPQLLKDNVLNMFRVFITYHKRCFTSGVQGRQSPADPILLIATPSFGSIKGGTNVTIIGETASLSPPQIGGSVCPIQAREANYIVCRAPFDRAIASSQVTLVNRITDRTVLAGNFTFGAEPRVTKVENMKTILSGGTDVVLQGENFESIQRPLMEIEALYKGGSWQFTSVCKVVSNTEMICRVPPLINPRALDPRTIPTVAPGDPYRPFMNTKRKKRSVVKNELQDAIWPFSLWTQEQDVRHQHNERRQKREVCSSEGGSDRGNPLNDNQELRYEMIFQFDQQTIQGSPSYTLDVYLDPILYRFENHPTCKIMKDTQIDIMGANLSYPLTCEDYKISIGAGDCEVQQIYEDRIICKPPEEEPETDPGDNSEQLNMWVAIGGTRLVFFIGCIEYENKNDFPTAWYGFIAALAALIVVILIMSVVICIRCRK